MSKICAMTALVVSIGFLTSHSSKSTAQEIEIPEGIDYKRADDEVNEKAKEAIENAFSSDEPSVEIKGLIGRRLICGPGLWKNLKADEEIAELKKGVVVFRIPTMSEDGKKELVQLQGKLFQSEEEIELFANTLVEQYDFDEARTIRKLNPKELNYHWAMIAWGIEEPIFVVETESHRILMSFDDDQKILMIDDLELLESPAEDDSDK